VKNLFEGWHKFLNEEKIKPSSNPDLALFVSKDTWDNGKLLFLYDRVALSQAIEIIRRGDPAVSRIDFGDFIDAGIKLSSCFIGVIVVSKPRVKDVGKCAGSYQVDVAGVGKPWRGQGYGRLLYAFAMMLVYPHPLMPDRGSVSKQAKRAWLSFSNKAQIEKVPKDKPPYLGHFDNKENPRTKPTDDDCWVHGDNILDRGYRYSSPKNRALYNSLIKKSDQFCQELMAKKVKLDWDVIAEEYFFRIYDSGG